MKVIERMSEEAGYAVVEDTRGNYHILNAAQPQPEITVNMQHETQYFESVLLCGLNTTNFPNITAFHPLYDLLTGLSYVRYTIPSNKNFVLEQIIANETREGLSQVGIYKNNVISFAFPFYKTGELNTNILYHPLEVIEIKFKPAVVNTRTSILLKGILINI